MPPKSGTRRAYLRGLAGAGALATGMGAIRTGVEVGRAQSDGEDDDCTPGHTEGDPPCQQILDDTEVRTRFDSAGTSLPITFEYPCGWRTSTADQFDDRSQANVTRDDFDAYVDVQVRCYFDPVDDGFLESERADGDYETVEYDYAGEPRTGIVSSRDNADFGTIGHATIPFAGELVHVELASTLHGTDCEIIPRPDFWVVRDALTSLEPNLESTFVEQSESVPRPASVTITDQVVSEAGTLVVVEESTSPTAAS